MGKIIKILYIKRSTNQPVPRVWLAFLLILSVGLLQWNHPSTTAGNLYQNTHYTIKYQNLTLTNPTPPTVDFVRICSTHRRTRFDIRITKWFITSRNARACSVLGNQKSVRSKKNLSLSYVPREPPKLVCDLESRLGPTSYPIPKITKSFNI